MAKQIKGNEIIEDNHLSNAIKSGEDYLKVLKEIDAQIVKNAKNLKASLSGSNTNSAKSIKAQSQALSESEKKKAAVLKIDKERANLEIKLKALNSDKIQQNQQLKILTQEQAKTNKQAARETLGLVGAYEKESKLLIRLRKELKDLILTEGEGSKKTKQLADQVNNLDNRLKKADAAAGQFQRNVGNYKNGLKGAISTVKRLGAAFGVFAGLQLAVRGIRNMFNVVKDFEQGTANLASVLGVNVDQMTELTEQAKELGATTIFTASQVLELANAFAKLGFTQEEIKGVTEATLELAAATGSDLGTSATVVGSTLRAFGLDVSETQRVVDVMAKSFSSSSLDMEKFTVAMRAVAPVAKNAGLNIEETTALLGTLTDAGIDASTAGTGLRNVFLELAKRGMTFEEAMSEINNATDKNATSLALFGKRGAVVGTVLAESGVSADALTEKLNNAGGAAKEMADKQLDTLGGAVKLLSSAWEGWILKMNDASGAGGFLTDIIKFLAENLEQIISIISKVVAGFLAYKVAIKSATLANNLFNKSINVKRLGSWVGVLVTVALAVWDIVDGLINAKDANDLFNETMDKANELLEVEKDKLKLVGRELLDVNTTYERRDELIKQINAEYGTTLENLEDEAEFAKQVALAYQDLIDKLDRKIKLQVVEEDLLEATKEVRRLKRELEDAQEDSFRSPFEDSIPEIVDNLGKQMELVELLKSELITLQNTGEKTLGAKNKGGTLVNRFEKTTESIEGATGAIKDLKEELVDFDIDEYYKGVDLGEGIELESPFILPEYDSDEATKLALKSIEDQDKLDKKLIQQQKDFAQKSLNITKTLIDSRIAEIDREIDAKKDELDVSNNEISRLQALGTAEANEALKAEKVRQTKQKSEIKELQKKKANLLITISTLELANSFIQQGDGKGLTRASNKMEAFLSGLPKLYDGTKGTMAADFGATGTRDGHLAMLHDNEHVIGANDSNKLHAAGLTKNADIVNSAIAYQNGALNNRATRASVTQKFTDKNIVNKLQSVEEAINKIDLPTSHYNQQTGVETVRYKNKVINIDHKPSTFKI